MKKFAANYVISESGDLLKNSILIAEDDGTVLEYIDTKGNLQEMARLTFLNGILLSGFSFVRVREPLPVPDDDHRFSSLFLPEIEDKNEISIQRWLEICKQIPAHFPDLVITEIFEEITNRICQDGGFRKEYEPGIYLLTGIDLLVLKLTPNIKLKRIL